MAYLNSQITDAAQRKMFKNRISKLGPKSEADVNAKFEAFKAQVDTFLAESKNSENKAFDPMTLAGITLRKTIQPASTIQKEQRLKENAVFHAPQEQASINTKQETEEDLQAYQELCQLLDAQVQKDILHYKNRYAQMNIIYDQPVVDGLLAIVIYLKNNPLKFEEYENLRNDLLQKDYDSIEQRSKERKLYEDGRKRFEDMLQTENSVAHSRPTIVERSHASDNSQPANLVLNSSKKAKSKKGLPDSQKTRAARKKQIPALMASTESAAAPQSVSQQTHPQPFDKSFGFPQGMSWADASEL